MNLYRPDGIRNHFQYDPHGLTECDIFHFKFLRNRPLNYGCGYQAIFIIDEYCSQLFCKHLSH